MATAREIRRRIRSVRNIAKITKAMQLFAAARMRRAQARVLAARPYADALSDVLSGLFAVAESVRADGRAVIDAAVLAYDVYCSLCDAVDWNSNGWDQPVYAVLATAVGAGKHADKALLTVVVEYDGQLSFRNELRGSHLSAAVDAGQSPSLGRRRRIQSRWC